MLAMPATFTDAIRASHKLAVRVVVYPTNGDDPFEIPVEDGSVTQDRTADVRRQCSLQISDATLYPDSPTDPVNVFGAEVTVERGVALAGGVELMAMLGRFRLEDAGRSIPAGSLQISGWDASRQVIDERFLKPRKLSQMTGVALIELLIGEVQRFGSPQFDLSDLTDTTTLIPKHSVDRDRWAEVKRVAQLLGAEVYPTADNVWRIADVPDPQNDPVVWDIDAGPTGVLVQVDHSVTREGACNIVVVTGESKDGNQDGAYGVAQDLNPLSPTYANGRFGKVARFYSSPHVKTNAQAVRVAQGQLRDHLGLARSVSFTAVPNPALEAGDVIRLVLPDGSKEKHVIDTLAIGLGPSGTMTGETRAVEWDAQ